MVKMGNAIGDTANASKFGALSKSMRTAFHQVFFNESSGRYGSGNDASGELLLQSRTD